MKNDEAYVSASARAVADQIEKDFEAWGSLPRPAVEMARGYCHRLGVKPFMVGQVVAEVMESLDGVTGS